MSSAIRCGDSEGGAKPIEPACAKAAKQLGTHVAGATGQNLVSRAFCKTAKQIIADFGDSIEVTELLNTLDACPLLPELFRKSSP